MRKWTRWQDWAALAAGVLMAITPLWSYPGRAGTWTMVTLGAVLALASMWSLYDPGAIASEYTHAALGVLMFIAPWVFTYTDTTTAAYTSWVLGVIAVVVGVLAVPESRKAHQPIAH